MTLQRLVTIQNSNMDIKQISDIGTLVQDNITGSEKILLILLELTVRLDNPTTHIQFSGDIKTKIQNTTTTLTVSKL